MSLKKEAEDDGTAGRLTQTFRVQQHQSCQGESGLK